MPKVIEARELAKSYGKKKALQGISFELGTSEILGFIGPNGAGKTTTIRLMVGLLNATSGKLSVLGSDPRKSKSIRADIGYIPGEFGLWPQMTGAETLEHLGSFSRRVPTRRGELCELFELSAKDLERPTRTYSRGTRQKIAIIQAFETQPKLIVMDEPTEGLDPLMKERFISLVKEHRASGGSAFFSSHILSEVEECVDRVAVIRNGTIIKVADIESLSTQRVRHCQIKSKGSIETEVLTDLEGVTNLRVADHVTKFDFIGDMQPLMRTLATLDVIEFLSEPESLTEAFFEVYSEEQEAE